MCVQLMAYLKFKFCHVPIEIEMKVCLPLFLLHIFQRESCLFFLSLSLSIWFILAAISLPSVGSLTHTDSISMCVEMMSWNGCYIFFVLFYLLSFNLHIVSCFTTNETKYESKLYSICCFKQTNTFYWSIEFIHTQ